MHTGFKSRYFKDLAELEADNFWFRGRSRIILWALGRYSPALSSFLEIGCGTGFVLSGISKQFPGIRLLGGEYLEEGLTFARQRVPDAEFTRMDACRISHDSELDAVGAFDVLEHIEADAAVLRQIHKALKPRGYLFITVPQHPFLWSAVDECACHVRRYTAGELREKVCRAGFEIVRTTSFVSILLPVMALSRLRQRNKTDMDIDDMDGLRIHPVLNKILEQFLRFELALIRLGVSLPAGGSRLVIARKPEMIHKDA